ncbi:succinyl-diaminopimelate desuccinylase [Bacillus thermophilus]|uniref:Probable succinyl-diaminopimelate desuccinylase n=1 Tax=Siminovitchia thermophila TaxID=1245522 RepID=A0ABS2R5L6_9BACI|nr:M20 family metallopeptidase [Siminovitchia thermophila]MBM7714690.1 succinyl-diaminopimelate desuccinylase [Siminovitchia thermophila]ONK24526.1 succinyl-diaminopimelate desuccinylase [Bacillus sp. VT-16-64]
MVNQERAIKFLQKLIKIKSVNPPGNELGVAKAIVEHAAKADLQTEIKALSSSRANVIVRLKGNGSKHRSLLFSGHLDTVPVGETEWKHSPFSGSLINGKIFGRGSCDMKSGVAALIEAMITLKETRTSLDHDVVFVGTAGEEVDCIGASMMVNDEALKNAGAMVIAEPSNGKVFTAHKGALWIEIKLFGKTAHGSMPHEGINAIVHMSELIERLKHFSFSYEKEHKLLGKPTLTISTVNGGIKTNLVPDQCKVTIDIRTIPEIKHGNIIKDIKEILKDLEMKIAHFKAELKIINDLPALENERDSDFVSLALELNKELNKIEAEEKGANYYTDASVFFPALKIPTIIYGPGDEKLAHQSDEYVEVKKYIRAIQYYAEIAKRF